MKTEDEESALARWSRRKKESTRTAVPPVDETTLLSTATADETAEALNEITVKPEIDQLCDQDMPAIETLDENSSYAEFFSKNVSDGLRKLALQKLFHCKSYNICDGLDDYDGNYTAFEKLDASIITADMKHRLEMEAQERLEQLAEADDIQESDAEQAVAAETADKNNDPELTASTSEITPLPIAEDHVAMPANEKPT